MKSLVPALFIVFIIISTSFNKVERIHRSKEFSTQSISGHIWEDTDGSGFQDQFENGLSGVNVNLYNSNGNLISSKVSDYEGKYLFEAIQPGDYYIEFDVSPIGNYYFTNPDNSTDDSDVDNSNGEGTTAMFTLQNGSDIDNIDAGCYQKVCNDIAASTCEDAVVLCNVNYIIERCYIMPAQYQQTVIPGCPLGTAFFNNPSWFAFVVGDEDVSMIIHFYNCDAGNKIQWGVYDDCDLENPVSLQCKCVPAEDVSIDLTGLTPGKTYHLFIDGCNGAMCNYSFEVIKGGEKAKVQGPSKISCYNNTIACDTACINKPLSLEMIDILNANNFVWTINGKADTTKNPDTTFYFSATGDYTICGYGFNDCGIGEQKCIDLFLENCNCLFDTIYTTITYNNCYKNDSLAKIVVDSFIGAVKPVQYKWSTGDTLNFVDSLATGFYYLTVTDSLYCSIIDTFEIKLHKEMQIIYYKTFESCDSSCDGTITIQNVVNSIPPLEYKWSNGDSTAITKNLCSGVYYITITDSLACPVIDTILIESQPDLNISSTLKDASCYGVCDGMIDIQGISNSTPPLEFIWSNGDTTSTVTNLCLGDYVVSITDSIGCISIDTFHIGQPEEILITIDSLVNIKGEQNGGIFVNTNNNGHYIYSWSGPNGYSNNSKNISELDMAGCYDLVVTDTLTKCTADTTICISKFSGLNENFNSATDIFIYPNPTSGLFMLDFGSTKPKLLRVEIYNIEGKKVLDIKKKIKNNHISLELPSIESGVYFIKISFGNSIQYKKLLKL